MTELTVVIVTYNSAGHLPACARALGPALAGLTARLVIVDNASIDGSADMVATLWPDAAIVRNTTNRGFAAAVNQGVALADAPSILLLNPDAQPTPGAIRLMLEHLTSHPSAGIVAARLCSPDGRPLLSCYPFPTLATIVWRYLRLGRLLPHAGGGRYRRATVETTSTMPVTVPWAQGACLLVRASMMAALGGFDEDFVLYAEEVDLTRRAAAQGWICDYLPSATVHHREGSSSITVPRLKLVSHYFSALHYFEKHQPRQLPALKVFFLVDLGLRWLARLPAIVTHRPADAVERRAAYAIIARSILTDPATRRLTRWRALATTVRPRPQGGSVPDHGDRGGTA